MKIVVVALLLCSFSALAEENFSYRGKVEPRKVNRLIGKIQDAFNEGEMDIKIRLNSEGGDLGAAFRLYNFVKELNSMGARINTSVREYCGSACTVIYASGMQRWASTRADFMFHTPTVQTKGISKKRKKEIEQQYRAMWLGVVAQVDTEAAEWLIEKKAFHSDVGRTLNSKKLDTGYVSHFY